MQQDKNPPTAETWWPSVKSYDESVPRADAMWMVMQAFMSGSTMLEIAEKNELEGHNPKFSREDLKLLANLIGSESSKEFIKKTRELIDKSEIREDGNFVFVYNEDIDRWVPQVTRYLNVTRRKSKIIVVNGNIMTYPENRGVIDKEAAIEVAKFVSRNLATDARNKRYLQQCKNFLCNIVAKKATPQPESMLASGNI